MKRTSDVDHDVHVSYSRPVVFVRGIGNCWKRAGAPYFPHSSWQEPDREEELRRVWVRQYKCDKSGECSIAMTTYEYSVGIDLKPISLKGHFSHGPEDLISSPSQLLPTRHLTRTETEDHSVFQYRRVLHAILCRFHNNLDCQSQIFKENVPFLRHKH